MGDVSKLAHPPFSVPQLSSLLHNSAFCIMNSQCSMVNCQLSMFNAQWSMLNGQWSILNAHPHHFLSFLAVLYLLGQAYDMLL